MTVGKKSLPFPLFRVPICRVLGTFEINAIFLQRARILLSLEENIADPLIADRQIEPPSQIGRVGWFHLDKCCGHVLVGAELLERAVEIVHLAQDVAHSLMRQRTSANPIGLRFAACGEPLSEYEVGPEFV